MHQGTGDEVSSPILANESGKTDTEGLPYKKANLLEESESSDNSSSDAPYVDDHLTSYDTRLINERYRKQTANANKKRRKLY